MSARKVIEIIEIDSKRVEKEIDVPGKNEREIEKIERGILRNLDTENYCTNVAERAQ